MLVVGAVVSTAVDWNTTHLFNQAWHPHARFHDGLFMALLDGTTLIMLWLLWRPSTYDPGSATPAPSRSGERCGSSPVGGGDPGS